MLESKAKVEASLASAHSRASFLGSDASVERAARASRRNRVDDDSLHVYHTAQFACNAWRSQQRHSSWLVACYAGQHRIAVVEAC